MRILLVWPSDDGPDMEDLLLAIKDHGHNIVYWVGCNDVKRFNFPGTIFQDHHEALNCIPAVGVDVSKFSPPGEKIIQQLADTESLIMTMMNKLFGWMNVDERRHVYYNMLQYWLGVFDEYKPEIVIFPIIPHTVYNYIIYALAKFYNIKTIMFVDTWVSDRLLVYSSFWEGKPELGLNNPDYIGKNYSLADISEDLREYYLKHTVGTGQKVSPPVMGYLEKRFSRLNIIRLKLDIVISSIRRGIFGKRLYRYIKRQLGPNLEKEYNAFQIKPDLSKKYIYMPLSVQPECSTSPKSGVFVDQILIIETLSAALPKDWVIYVKEHPSQRRLKGKEFSGSRYQGFFKRIAKVKNVYLVPIETDTYKLIENSQAVAVGTGTAAWEGLLRLKPVLIFGYIWYRDCPGAFKVRDTETVASALEKIAGGYKATKQDIINFLKKFDDISVHGYIDHFGEYVDNEGNQISKLSPQESMDNTIKLLLAEIKRQTAGE